MKLIKCPTHVTCNSSSILYHVLASFSDRVYQSGVIDGGISDHQLIYCTRKTARIKSYCHKHKLFLLSYKLFTSFLGKGTEKIKFSQL